MFSSNKIKISKDIFEKAKRYAEIAGYSSVEEFINTTIEKEINKLDEAESDEELKEKLQGLGYIS